MCVPASYAPRECTCVDQMLMNSIGNLFNFLLIRHSSHLTSQKSLDNLWHKGVTKNPGTSHMPYQKSVWSWCFLTAAAVLGSIHVYFHYQSGKEFYLIPLISRFVCTDASYGGDESPVELFQILKDDAVKVLHSICQQIWKTQQWPQDWKRSVFIPIPKKGNAKECSNNCTIALISHASKVMLKILWARLQQYMNCEHPDVQTGFRKGRGTGDQIANICRIIENAWEFQ